MAKKALKKKKENKIKKVMEEFKEGELDIGKSTKKVKSRKQAIAIALSEASEVGKKKRKKRKKKSKK